MWEWFSLNFFQLSVKDVWFIWFCFSPYNWFLNLRMEILFIPDVVFWRIFKKRTLHVIRLTPQFFFQSCLFWNHHRYPIYHKGSPLILFCFAFRHALFVNSMPWSLAAKRISINLRSPPGRPVKWDCTRFIPDGKSQSWKGEVEPVYIPELTYVEDSDYNNSGSQIPVFETFWSLYF